MCVWAPIRGLFGAKVLENTKSALFNISIIFDLKPPSHCNSCFISKTLCKKPKVECLSAVLIRVSRFLSFFLHACVARPAERTLYFFHFLLIALFISFLLVMCS